MYISLITPHPSPITPHPSLLTPHPHAPFTPPQSDLALPDNPKAFAFVGNSLIVCIKKELFRVTVSWCVSYLPPSLPSSITPYLLVLLSHTCTCNSFLLPSMAVGGGDKGAVQHWCQPLRALLPATNEWGHPRLER